MTHEIVRLIGNLSSLISAEWKTSYLPHQTLIPVLILYSISVFPGQRKSK